MSAVSSPSIVVACRLTHATFVAAPFLGIRISRSATSLTRRWCLSSGTSCASRRSSNSKSSATDLPVPQELTSLSPQIRNGALFASGPPTEYPSDRASNIEAWKAEHASLAAIVALVTQAIEAISFVLLLVDYKLPETVAKCVFSSPLAHAING